MIRALLHTDGNGRYTGYRICGHAGYANAGSDIVCAAASVLAITCVNSLESVCGIKADVTGGKDGLLAVQLPSAMTDEQRHDAQVLLGMLRQGFEDLAGEHPKFVQFSIVNGGKQP